MSKKEDDIPSQAKKIVTIFWIAVAIGGFVAYNQLMTVEESKAYAPCQLILNPDMVMPDNVITKGFDVTDDPNNVDGKICYFIKDATWLERTIYNWGIY